MSHATSLFRRQKLVIQLYPITMGSRVGYWYKLNNPTLEIRTLLASSGSSIKANLYANLDPRTVHFLLGVLQSKACVVRIMQNTVQVPLKDVREKVHPGNHLT